jgi:hypothetical protein
MRVTRVRGLHSSENGGTPAVELVLAPLPSRGPRTVEVTLHQVAHLAEHRVVVIVLKATLRGDDGFVRAPSQGPTVKRVTLAQLRARSLEGYRIVVQDDAGDTIGEGAWT